MNTSCTDSQVGKTSLNLNINGDALELLHYPSVSIIVPVYNDTKRLAMCLKALSSQNYPKKNMEIIVVDNGSYDNPFRLKKEFEHVNFVLEKKSGSYAARNKGLSISKGEFIAFTDSDCIPQRDWILKGLCTFLSTSECGMVVGRVKLFFRNPTAPTATEIYESIHAFNQEKKVNRDHYGATANLLTHRKVIDSVGKFNSDLKSGGDLEWGNRVFKAGYRQVYSKDVCVLHPARHTFKDIIKKTARVEGGVYDLGLRGDRSMITAVAGLSMLFVTLLALVRRSILSMSPFDRIPSSKLKLQYIIVFILVRAVKIIELQKLKYGYNSRRV